MVHLGLKMSGLCQGAQSDGRAWKSGLLEIKVTYRDVVCKSGIVRAADFVVLRRLAFTSLLRHRKRMQQGHTCESVNNPSHLAWGIGSPDSLAKISTPESASYRRTWLLTRRTWHQVCLMIRVTRHLTSGQQQPCRAPRTINRARMHAACCARHAPLIFSNSCIPRAHGVHSGRPAKVWPAKRVLQKESSMFFQSCLLLVDGSLARRPREEYPAIPVRRQHSNPCAFDCLCHVSSRGSCRTGFHEPA